MLERHNLLQWAADYTRQVQEDATSPTCITIGGELGINMTLSGIRDVHGNEFVQQIVRKGTTTTHVFDLRAADPNAFYTHESLCVGFDSGEIVRVAHHAGNTEYDSKYTVEQNEQGSWRTAVNVSKQGVLYTRLLAQLHAEYASGVLLPVAPTRGEVTLTDRNIRKQKVLPVDLSMEHEEVFRLAPYGTLQKLFIRPQRHGTAVWLGVFGEQGIEHLRFGDIPFLSPDVFTEMSWRFQSLIEIMRGNIAMPMSRGELFQREFPFAQV